MLQPKLLVKAAALFALAPAQKWVCPQSCTPGLGAPAVLCKFSLQRVVKFRMYGFISRVLGAMSAELCCRSRVWFVSFYTVKCQGPAGPALPQAEGAPWWTHRGEGVDHSNTPKLLLNTKKKKNQPKKKPNPNQAHFDLQNTTPISWPSIALMIPE